MKRHEIPDYLDWLCDIIGLYSSEYEDYTSLIKYLYTYQFRYCIMDDSNREKDANNLLYLKYMNEFGLPYDIERIHDREVSVLEVLIALSVRIERDVMGEPGEYDDARWFWTMLDNLGFMDCTNDVFDEELTDYILSKWLDREFAYNGNGSPFPLKHPNRNQKNVEIWYQMHGYMNENFPI